FISVIEDITRRKQAEELLSRAERRFRWLISASPVGVVQTRIDGVVTHANRAFYSIVGWDRDEFARQGMDLRRLTPPDWLEISDRKIRESSEGGGSVLYEKEYLRHDGTRVPVLIGLCFSREGEDEALAFVLDLSEQKRNLERLARSEESLRFAQ